MSAVLSDPLLSFRPMTEDDLHDILQIEVSAYAHPWSKMIFQDCLRVGYCCWVLASDDRTIGYGVMTVAVGECHILNLCIAPDMQNAGYGAMLLDRLLDIAKKHNADTAFLEVRPSNHIAIMLYRHAGFDEVGLRRDYYPAEFGREDALIFARSLL